MIQITLYGLKIGYNPHYKGWYIAWHHLRKKGYEKTKIYPWHGVNHHKYYTKDEVLKILKRLKLRVNQKRIILKRKEFMTWYEYCEKHGYTTD